MTHPNQRKLEDAYADSLGGDVSKILEMLHADVSWRATGQGPVAGLYQGPDGVLAFFAKMFEVYGETLRLTVRATLADDRYGMC